MQKNPGALGNVWFVDSINWVKNADEEMAALNDFSPKSTAIVDSRYKGLVKTNVEYDSSRTINLIDYSTDKMTYQYNSSNPCLAVFSEIYYKGNEDWKAYIDGEYTPHFRANYVLRAMSLPAGEHKVEFKFEPQTFKLGEVISLSSSILILLLLSLVTFRELKK